MEARLSLEFHLKIFKDPLPPQNTKDFQQMGCKIVIHDFNEKHRLNSYPVKSEQLLWGSRPMWPGLWILTGSWNSGCPPLSQSTVSWFFFMALISCHPIISACVSLFMSVSRKLSPKRVGLSLFSALSPQHSSRAWPTGDLSQHALNQEGPRVGLDDRYLCGWECSVTWLYPHPGCDIRLWFSRCCHWGKLGKGSLCIMSYNCMWIYNDFKIKSLILRSLPKFKQITQMPKRHPIKYLASILQRYQGSEK